MKLALALKFAIKAVGLKLGARVGARLINVGAKLVVRFTSKLALLTVLLIKAVMLVAT